MRDNDERMVLKPKLRFPEFRKRDGWKANTLKELTNELLDGDWIETKDQSSSGFRLIQTGNIGVGCFIAKESKARYVSEEAFERLRCTEVFPGDCLISRLPDPAGRSCLLPDLGGRMITAVDCTIVRFKQQKIIPYLFIAHSQTDAYFREVASLSSGSTRQRISRENLSQLVIALPSIPEQQKIANCLAPLDKLIAAQEQKLAALTAHKKGLMQHLFPGDGETTPRLRFPEFRKAPAWEERPAGRLFANRTEEGEEGLPIYSVTMTNGLVKRSSLDRSVDDIAEADGNRKAFKNDIAYNMMRMWQGASGVAVEDCMVSPAYVVLVPQTGAHSHFFAFLLKLPKYLRLLASHSQGLTKDRLRLYYRDFARIPLPSPDIHEQEKIANLLSSIDGLIAAEAERLEVLKTHKKGLMQQLFPSPEEMGG